MISVRDRGVLLQDLQILFNLATEEEHAHHGKDVVYEKQQAHQRNKWHDHTSHGLYDDPHHLDLIH